MDALEIAYLILLILTSVLIAWFSLYVVYKLFQGQR